MTGDAAKRTFGENFLLELQKAESRGLLFAVVEDTAARFYPQYNLEVQLGKLSDFDSVAVYQDKLARVRISFPPTAWNCSPVIRMSGSGCSRRPASCSNASAPRWA